MNMQNLMIQAKKMQRDLEKAQKELEEKEYIGKSQLVNVTLNGKGRIISMDINMNDISADDKEILEDMVIVAVNDAIEKMEKEKEEKFGKYGQMVNGLF